MARASNFYFFFILLSLLAQSKQPKPYCSQEECETIADMIKNKGGGDKALREFMDRTVESYDDACDIYPLYDECRRQFKRQLKRMHAALGLFQQADVQCVRDVEYSSNVNDVTVVEFHSLVAEMLQKRRAFCVYAAKNKTFGKRMKQFYETQLERVQLSFWKMMNATKTSTITANTTEPNFTSITTKDWTIDGWMNGPRGPLALPEIKSESCPFKRNNQTDSGRNQISSKFAMKICARKDHNCTQGLILCYQSRMLSGVRKLNFDKINVVVNRTAPFQLGHIDGDPIDQICNNEDLWHDWFDLKKHGFNVSSDGNVVEIQTSYDKKISVAKLNDKSGCAVFHFDHTNKATAGEEGTIWKIKQAETNPMESSTKMEEEITDEASMENSTATNKNVSDANPENSTKTAAEDEVSETSTENSSTRTAVEEEDPEPEEEYNEPAEDEENNTHKKFGEFFWRKLRSGVRLRNFDPLVTLPYDVLAGVEPNQDLFTIWQHQNKKMASKCQMRITFQADCSASCVDTPNL